MRKVKATLSGIVCVASVIALVALAGGLEQEMLTISQYTGFSALALVALALGARRTSK